MFTSVKRERERRREELWALERVYTSKLEEEIKT